MLKIEVFNGILAYLWSYENESTLYFHLNGSNPIVKDKIAHFHRIIGIFSLKHR